jgi:hypothetical protein
MFTPDSSGTIIPFVIIVIAIIGYILHSFHIISLLHPRHLKDATDSDGSSLLLSFYGAGHRLNNLGGPSHINGINFSAYITEPLRGTITPGTAYVAETALIYKVDLPFNTVSHLIGLNKAANLDRLEIAAFLKAHGMEKIILEGDFKDYFDIYANKNEQVLVREVLHPRAMAYVVDYCRSHFWEISGSELYFVIRSHDKDENSVIDESQQFIEAIKPAQLPGMAGAPLVHRDLPYGTITESALNCPLCATLMEQYEGWQACKTGHGILLSARDFIRLHNHELAVQLVNPTPEAHGPLTCPNCHSPMEQTGYQESTIQINVCTNCPFRWLDADSLMAITSGKVPGTIVNTNGDSVG